MPHILTAVPLISYSKINISGNGDHSAVPAITSSLGKGQSSQNLSVQICQYASDPDLLVLSHEQRGNPSVSLPFVQELPIRVENLDARMVPIGDVNLSLRVDHHIVRQAEFAGPRSSLAKLEQIFSIARELHYAGAAIPVAHIDIAIGREGHIGRQVEIVVARAGDSLLAEQHQNIFPLRVHLVDHLTGG